METVDPVRSSRDVVVVGDDATGGIDEDVLQVTRLIALVTAAIVLGIGVVALLRIDWDGAELDSPVVEVAQMTFTPIAAMITTGIGVLLLAAAVVRDGDARIFLGAVLATIGAVIILADDVAGRWTLTDRQGWLAVGFGAIFILVGALTDSRLMWRRRYREQLT